MSRITYPEPITPNAAACDADGCDTWTRDPEVHGFLEVIWGDQRSIYCSTNCLLRDIAGRSTPMEVIDPHATQEFDPRG